MGHLYRREGSPFWWARWYDSEGGQRRESTKSADRRVATLFLSARESEAIREVAGVPTAKRVALADAFGQYLDAHAPPVWSPRWHYTVKHWVRLRIQPALGGPDALVSSVTRVTVEAARALWLKEVKPPTVNRLCTVGSGFFKWASDPDRCYSLSNPFSRWPKFAETKRHPPKASAAALGVMLGAIPNPHLRRAALVSIDTGLRLSELRRCRVDDVHGRLLHVVSSYQRGTTKNRRERWLTLTARALEALQAQQEAAGDDLFATMPVNNRKSLAIARKKAGLEHVRWHDLRHYGLTRAAQAGVLPHDLRAMAGWVGDESGRYVHPEAEGMAPLIAAVDRECASAVQAAGATVRNPEHSRDTHEKKTIKKRGSLG